MVFFLLITLTSLISAGAPRDVDVFCRERLPVYLPNVVVLMDSYSYINLLFPHSNPVWQQVDTDDNNVLGRGTQWIQDTNIPCRQNVHACGYDEGPQSNWLITQFINRTNTGGTIPPNIKVLVEFEQGNCERFFCKETFDLYVYETSFEDNRAANSTSRYQRVPSVTDISIEPRTRHNLTIDLDLSMNEDGFYLAIVDTTLCIRIFRVVVFYHVCPEGVMNLSNLPETLVPSLQTSLLIQAQCVVGARLKNKNITIFSCNQEGVWKQIQGHCICNPGLLPSENGRSCIGCPVGTYLSVNHQDCRICPENSEGKAVGLTECPCKEGYARVHKEISDMPCSAVEVDLADGNYSYVTTSQPDNNTITIALVVPLLLMVVCIVAVSIAFLICWKRNAVRRRRESVAYEEVDIVQSEQYEMEINASYHYFL